jgi:hypothetical protein
VQAQSSRLRRERINATLGGQRFRRATGDLSCGSGEGCGIVFKLDPSENFTVLHSFTDPDGSSLTAALIRDSTGDLFSTTSAAGAFSGGTVFKLSPTRKLSVLHRFGRGNDGRFPTGGVILDSSCNLFGTTVRGGGSGFGTVYKVIRELRTALQKRERRFRWLARTPRPGAHLRA